MCRLVCRPGFLRSCGRCERGYSLKSNFKNFYIFIIPVNLVRSVGHPFWRGQDSVGEPRIRMIANKLFGIIINDSCHQDLSCSAQIHDSCDQIDRHSYRASRSSIGLIHFGDQTHIQAHAHIDRFTFTLF